MCPTRSARGFWCRSPFKRGADLHRDASSSDSVDDIPVTIAAVVRVTRIRQIIGCCFPDDHILTFHLDDLLVCLFLQIGRAHV